MNESPCTLHAALAPYLSLPRLRRLVARDAARLRDALIQPTPPADLLHLLAALSVLLEPPQRAVISAPDDLAALLLVEMGHLAQEQLRVVLLTTRHHLVAIETVYVGTVNSAAVREAEIFRPAVQRNTPALIVVHNHPSGDATPSPEDVLLTRQLVAAGTLLGIELVDHLVIGQGQWTSMRSLGLGFERVGMLAHRSEL